eukprot:gene31619-6813_t
MTTSARNGVARSAPPPQRTRSVCRALDLDPAAGQAPAAADEAPLDAIPEDPRELISQADVRQETQPEADLQPSVLATPRDPRGAFRDSNKEVSALLMPKECVE